MLRRALSISVVATLLFMGGVSAEAADHMFTVRVENVSVGNILKLSNGKTAAVTVAPVLYVIHTNREPLNTIGMVAVAALAAMIEGPPPTAAMTATRLATRSAASAGSRWF